MKKLPIVRWFDDLKSALSIYIAGNVAPSGGVTAGKFYFWKGKLRLPTSNISAGETLTDSNMPVVSEGGLNKVNEKIDNLILVDNVVINSPTFQRSSAGVYYYDQSVTVPEGYVLASATIVGWTSLSGLIQASIYGSTTIELLANSAVTVSYITVRLVFIKQ